MNERPLWGSGQAPLDVQDWALGTPEGCLPAAGSYHRGGIHPKCGSNRSCSRAPMEFPWPRRWGWLTDLVHRRSLKLKRQTGKPAALAQDLRSARQGH